MKLSNRETQVLDAIKRLRTVEFTLDELCAEVLAFAKPEDGGEVQNFRGSIGVTLRSLMKKLNAFGVKIHRTTPLGRGSKANFLANQSIHRVK